MADVWWNDSPLRLRIEAARLTSIEGAKGVASGLCQWPSVRSSIYATAQNPADLGARDPKSIWLEEGTRPHTETAVNAQALHFADGGFAQSVNHPGTQAHPFLHPAAQAWPSIFGGSVRGATLI